MFDRGRVDCFGRARNVRVRVIRLISLAVVAVVAGVGVPPTGALAASGLVGAGSSLVAPLMAEWSAAFGAFHGASVSYYPVGSQAAVNDISARAVDFATSEAPMTFGQRVACNGCYQIPCALSAVGIGYHLDGLGRGLYLNGKLLAQIYLGEITRWNDPRIKAVNPRASLPNARITPIYSDASGTTYTFTRYLSKVSASWRHTVGYGLSVSFPAGVAANSLAAVGMLQSTNGAIAYLGAAYLIADRLPAAAIENSAGQFEYPNLSEIESAGRTIKHVPASNALEIVDPPRTARIAYPIATFTYLIVPANAPQKSLLDEWVSYALGAGQAFGASLDFAALPSNVLRASEATAIQFHSSP
jgi:phosphate transport system substrate-binding protein